MQHTPPLPVLPKFEQSATSEDDGPKEMKELEEEDEPKVQACEAPIHIKCISLAAIMLLPLGVNWASASLGPLKNTLRKEMGINNEQFGVISSADAVVNSIWPLVGGIALDWLGVQTIAPLCTVTILLGSIVSALGVNLTNWRLLAGGYIIQGFGTALLDSCQHVFFHAYGGRRGLAFAFALENAFANATGASARAAAIPIQRALGTQWVFWIPVIFCGLSCGVNGLYLWYARSIMPSKYRLTSRKDQNPDLGKRRTFVLLISAIWMLPWCFWMLPMSQILQSGTVGGMQSSFNDIIRMKGYTESVAGFLQAGSQVLKCLLGPCLGYAIDRWGHRFHYVAVGPVLWVTCQALFNYSSVHPMVSLVISALAQVLSAGPLQMALHLLVADHHLIGTAFGVWRAYSNAGSTVMEVVFGKIQDNTPGGGYFRVLNLAMGLKALAFFIALGYIFVDYRYLGRGLTMTRKKRDVIEEQILAEKREASDPVTKRISVRAVTNSGIVLLAGLLVAAWVLFFMGLAG